MFEHTGTLMGGFWFSYYLSVVVKLGFKTEHQGTRPLFATQWMENGKAVRLQRAKNVLEVNRFQASIKYNLAIVVVV